MRSGAWAPSGETLATASFDSNIGVWEREKGDEVEDGTAEDGPEEWECISTLEGHETECNSVAYSATGTLLASCSRDKTVWIWEGDLYWIFRFCFALTVGDLGSASTSES